MAREINGFFASGADGLCVTLKGLGKPPEREFPVLESCCENVVDLVIPCRDGTLPLRSMTGPGRPGRCVSVQGITAGSSGWRHAGGQETRRCAALGVTPPAEIFVLLPRPARSPDGRPRSLITSRPDSAISHSSMLEKYRKVGRVEDKAFQIGAGDGRCHRRVQRNRRQLLSVDALRLWIVLFFLRGCGAVGK